MKYQCPECKTLLESPKEDIGKSGECPKCSREFIISKKLAFQRFMPDNPIRMQVVEESKQVIRQTNMVLNWIKGFSLWFLNNVTTRKNASKLFKLTKSFSTFTGKIIGGVFLVLISCLIFVLVIFWIKEESKKKVAFQEQKKRQNTDNNSVDFLSDHPNQILGISSNRLDIESLYKQSIGSVVVVRSGNDTGSGFFVSRDGYLVTNSHVVGRKRKLKIRLTNGSDWYNASLIRRLPEYDLALLKVTSTSTFQHLLGGRFENVSVGETVVVIGSPRGLDGTITRGIVSNKVSKNGLKVIQTDAAINPGNSGGPIISLKTGKVIGVATFYLRESENVGFGISVDHVNYLIKNKRNY